MPNALLTTLSGHTGPVSLQCCIAAGLVILLGLIRAAAVHGSSTAAHHQTNNNKYGLWRAVHAFADQLGSWCCCGLSPRDQPHSLTLCQCVETQVRGLDFNSNASNLLASGAADGETLVWDLTNPQAPNSFKVVSAFRL